MTGSSIQNSSGGPADESADQWPVLSGLRQAKYYVPAFTSSLANSGGCVHPRPDKRAALVCMHVLIEQRRPMRSTVVGLRIDQYDCIVNIQLTRWHAHQ